VTVPMAYKEIPRCRASVSLISRSASETFQIGKTLAQHLKQRDCVALIGDLGAGKTCLTQGIAKGLGVSDSYSITSPTFTLINEYPGTHNFLYHIDVYRLKGSADLNETGYEEYLSKNGVTVIEWAEKIMDVIPDKALIIEITYLSQDIRKIEIFGCLRKIASWERILCKRGGY
jgi:tRNA threonylcarbamoyladenosine biosynthesis protein TsaE